MTYIPEDGHRRWTEEGSTHQGAPRWVVPTWCPPLVLLFWYISHFDLENIMRGHSGRSAAVSRQNSGRRTFVLRRSCSAGETSLSEGEIITIIITNDPLIGRGSVSINIFTSTISSKNPSSSLVSNHVSKPQIGTCGLLVVLITPCS